MYVISSVQQPNRKTIGLVIIPFSYPVKKAIYLQKSLLRYSNSYNAYSNGIGEGGSGIKSFSPPFPSSSDSGRCSRHSHSLYSLTCIRKYRCALVTSPSRVVLGWVRSEALDWSEESDLLPVAFVTDLDFWWLLLCNSRAGAKASRPATPCFTFI